MATLVFLCHSSIAASFGHLRLILTALFCAAWSLLLPPSHCTHPEAVVLLPQSSLLPTAFLPGHCPIRLKITLVCNLTEDRSFDEGSKNVSQCTPRGVTKKNVNNKQINITIIIIISKLDNSIIQQFQSIWVQIGTDLCEICCRPISESIRLLHWCW